MLDAEFEVCTECGTLHMEGGAGPRDVAECAVCGGRVRDVELDDIIGLQTAPDELASPPRGQ